MTKIKSKKLEKLNKHRHKIWMKYYDFWRKNPVFCPALERDVVIKIAKSTTALKQ